MDRMNVKTIEQNDVKEKNKKIGRFNKFQEKCISGCLLVLFTVAPMISGVKTAKAEEYNNYYSQSNASQTYNPQIDRYIHLNYEFLNNNTTVKLSWNLVQSAISYYASCDDINTKEHKEVSNIPNIAAATCLDITPGHSYRFFIKAQFQDGTGVSDDIDVSIPYSQNQQPVIVTNPTPTTVYNPPQPAVSPEIALKPNVSHEIIGNTVKLTWNNVPNAVRYVINKHSYSPMYGELPDDTHSDFHYTTDTYYVTPGNRYLFTVLAYDANGYNGKTDIDNIIIPVTPQVSINNSQSTVSPEISLKPNVRHVVCNNTIQFFWESVPGAVRYEIARRGYDSYNRIVDSGNIPNTNSTYAYNNMQQGIRYEFDVIAIDANGHSGITKIQNISVAQVQAQQPQQTTPTYTQPTQPTNQQSQINTQTNSVPFNANTIANNNTVSNNVNNNVNNSNINVNIPQLPAPTINMPDVENTVFYCKDTQALSYNWTPINGAVKYKIEITDTSVNPNIVSTTNTTSLTTDTLGVLGGHGYKIWITPIDSQGRSGNRAEYIIEEGRIVTRDLQLNCTSGKDVMMLHRKLNYLALNTGLNPNIYDEIYRDATDTAVRAVQLYSGGVVDGVVGNDTWWNINNLVKQIDEYNRQGNAAAAENLRQDLNKRYTEIRVEKTVLGMNSTDIEAVKILQQKLNYLGLYTAGAQGIFGEQTELSVRALQRACGIYEDGVVGPKTWEAILDQIEEKKKDGDYAYKRDHGNWIQACREQIKQQKALANQVQSPEITTNISEIKITKDIDGNIYTKVVYKDGRTLINFRRNDNIYNIDQTFDVEKLKGTLNQLISEDNYYDDEYFNLWYNANQAYNQAILYVEGNNGKNCSFKKNDPEFYVLWYEILEYNTWKADTVQKFFDVGFAAFMVVDLGIISYEYLALRAETAALLSGRSITMSGTAFRSVAEVEKIAGSATSVEASQIPREVEASIANIAKATTQQEIDAISANTLARVRNIEELVIESTPKYSSRIISPTNDAKIYNRVIELRSKLTSNFKNKGNFGYADVNISGINKKEFYSHSSINQLTGDLPQRVPDISLQPQNPMFNAIRVNENNTIILEGDYLRTYDTEYKIINDIAGRLGNNTNASGTITLYTDRVPCPSCSRVINNFMNKYKNIKINVITNGGEILN